MSEDDADKAVVDVVVDKVGLGGEVVVEVGLVVMVVVVVMNVDGKVGGKVEDDEDDEDDNRRGVGMMKCR